MDGISMIRGFQLCPDFRVRAEFIDLGVSQTRPQLMSQRVSSWGQVGDEVGPKYLITKHPIVCDDAVVRSLFKFGQFNTRSLYRAHAISRLAISGCAPVGPSGPNITRRFRGNERSG